MNLFFKTGSDDYREVLQTPVFEFCRIMKFSTENYLLKQVFELAKTVLHGLLHECPYTVQYHRFKDYNSLVFVILFGFL